MATIKYREIARRIQLEGLPETLEHFTGALKDRVLNYDDFSLRDLAEATVVTADGEPCGREYVASCNPRRGQNVLMEAAGAVDSTAFATLTSQLIFNAVMKGYENPLFLADKLSRVIPSTLKREIIPGITGITEDMEDDVAEGMPFPAVGFGEDYVETPLTTKKGRTLNITKETLFHDQSKLIMGAAKAIGELLGRRKEKQWARVVAGIVNNYKWLGTSYNTYQTSAPWINVKASNGLNVATGWAQVDASEQLFNGRVDPWTAEPVTYVPNAILHSPARKHQFRQVFKATNFKASEATSSAHRGVDTPNSLDSYTLYDSRWLAAEIVASGVSASDAADWWFHGDFQEAFAWIENWPILTVQAPANSEAEFLQDIVMRFKTSMKGVYAVMQPRAVNKNYQA